MKDLRQSQNWAKYLREIGWITELIEDNYVFIKKIGPFSLIKIQRPDIISEKFIQAVDEISRKEKTLFIKIEPKNDEQVKLLKEHGYVKSLSPLIPSSTVILNLSPKIEDIKKTFSTNVKRILRKAENSDITHSFCVNPSYEELSDAYDTFEDSANFKKFGLPSFAEVHKQSTAFALDSKLLVTRMGKTPIAATLSFIVDERAYLIYAGTSKEGREKNAGHTNMFETIKKLKECGYSEFDLEGIFDERFGKVQDSWLGFSHFKKMYCKNEVLFPFPYTKTTMPLIQKIEQKMGRLPF